MADREQPDQGGQTARERVPDDVIAAAVRDALYSKLQFQIHPIEVSVHDGVVTLRGSIDSAILRQEAAQLAVMAPGVRELVNLIDVPGDWA